VANLTGESSGARKREIALRLCEQARGRLGEDIQWNTPEEGKCLDLLVSNDVLFVSSLKKHIDGGGVCIVMKITPDYKQRIDELFCIESKEAAVGEKQPIMVRLPNEEEIEKRGVSKQNSQNAKQPREKKKPFLADFAENPARWDNKKNYNMIIEDLTEMYDIDRKTANAWYLEKIKPRKH